MTWDKLLISVGLGFLSYKPKRVIGPIVQGVAKTEGAQAKPHTVSTSFMSAVELVFFSRKAAPQERGMKSMAVPTHAGRSEERIRLGV